MVVWGSPWLDFSSGQSAGRTVPDGSRWFQVVLTDPSRADQSGESTWCLSENKGQSAAQVGRENEFKKVSEGRNSELCAQRRRLGEGSLTAPVEATEGGMFSCSL